MWEIKGIRMPDSISYEYVDDAIRKGDIDSVEVMLKRRDRRLIRNIKSVAKYVGENNICVDDLISTPSYDSHKVFSAIAYGAAKSGNRELVMKILKYGCRDLSGIAYGAATGGHRDLVM